MRYKIYAVVLATACAAVVSGIASPAQAFIGLYRVTAVSAANGTSPKTVTVTCNAGDDIVSVGGLIDNGSGDVVLARAYLDAAGTTATASGIEAIPTAAAWAVRVFAVCAPGGALTNRSVVQSTSAFNNADKLQTAACPAGDNIVGGGFMLDNAFGLVSIDEVDYDPTLTSLSVWVYNNGAVGNYSLTVQAVCADPLPLQSLQTAVSASNPVGPKSMTSPVCPAGSQVSAVGAELTGALGEVSVSSLNPRPALVAGETIAEEVGPFAGNWSSLIQTVCIG